MPNINLEHLQPGMRLAADVVEQNGRVLLRAGTELSERQLGILKAWGITEANVVGVSPEQVAERTRETLDPVLLREAEQEARALFVHNRMEHPAVRELVRLFVLRRVREKAARGVQHAH